MTVFLTIGWLIHFCLTGGNPHWRTLLWSCVAASVLLLPVVSLTAPAFTVSVPGTAVLLDAVAIPHPASMLFAAEAGVNWPLVIWASVALLLVARTVLAGFRLNLAADEWLSVAEVMPKFKTYPPKPKIPEEIAQQLAEADTAVSMVIEFFIDEQGKVNRELSKIEKSSGYKELDKLALDWAVKAVFYPALDRGKPVKVKVRVPVQWKAE